jgi:thioredoxin-related protein
MTGFALACMLAAGALAEPLLKQDKAVEKSKGWLDNFEKAKTEAAALKQPIFAFFTGSDWCGWCMKLRSEVLDKKDFEAFAEANLVLFEADFPRGKKLSDDVKKQNAELAAKYGVRGYPTVYLLDADGKVLGQTGYQEGGVEAYVKHLQEMLGKSGVKAEGQSGAAKPLSAFEKLKAQQAAKLEAEANANAEAAAAAK